MFKLTKKKLCLGGLICCLAVSTVFALKNISNPTSIVNADSVIDFIDSIGDKNDFVVTDTKDEVLATYQYTRLNDTECSVRITNKTVATKAIIPDKIDIDGKKYVVTEVAANGFMSSPKLIRVKLPTNIKKIGNMAFANCASLERIIMSNIKEIGNNAFYKCPKLEKLILPASVETIGTTILRNNNTQVNIRSDSENANWSANWNDGNTNQDIIFNYNDLEPLELETVYSNNARSGEESLVGYALSDGQPRTDVFYEKDENNNIFIPSIYDGEYILNIESGAFSGISFNQLIIEISSQVMTISSNAFEETKGNSIVINRQVKFENEDGSIADNVFVFSEVKSIVLPNSITGITSSMFCACENLTNVYFNTPTYYELREDMLKIADNLSFNIPEGTIYLPKNETFESIAVSAFDCSPLINEIHIYENVKYVESGAFNGLDESAKIIIHNDNTDFTKDWNIDWQGLAEVVFINKVITFDPNGGTVQQENKIVKADEPIGTMPTPTKPYQYFVGWFDLEDVQYTENDIYSGDTNLTLYAHWEEYSYSIEYNSNRPNTAITPMNGDMSDTILKYSEAAELSENLFSIKGWHFIGWNDKKDGSGTNYADKESIKALCGTNNGKFIVYAQWEVNTFSIFYDKNQPDNASSIVSGAMSKSTHTYGSSSQLSDNTFTLKGWHFVSWNTLPNGTGDSFESNQDITLLTFDHQSTTYLYAQWEENQYSFVYEANRPASSNDVQGDMPDSVHKYEASSTLTINVYELKGWTFTGWSTQADGKGTKYTDGQNVSALDFSDNAKIMLFAQWKANNYFVTYNSNQPETYYKVEGTMADSIYTYDSAVSCLAAINFTLNGWKFTSWLDNDGNEYLDMAKAWNLTTENEQVITLYAQWEILTYSITFELNGGNNVNTVTEFTVDDEIPLLAPVKPGYIGKWSQSEIPRGTYQNIVITASYITRNFYIDCYMNDGTEDFTRIELKKGESCSLEPATRTNYYFGGWKYENEYITSIENIQTDMPLYAVWYSMENSSKYTVTDEMLKQSECILDVSGEKVILELSYPMPTFGIRINIKPNVKQFIIHSDTYSDYWINIYVETREQDIDIVALNFIFEPFHGYEAIYSESGCSINLYGYNCIIKGNSYKDAIVCKNLAICSPITVLGGGGDDKANGPCSAVKADVLTINSGYITLVGGDGYDKSGGTYAVHQSTEIKFNGNYKDTVIIKNGEDDNG